MTDNLPDLRDIHFPTEGVSAWPPAGGWWAILLGIVIGFVLFKSIRWLRAKSAKLYAQHLLNALEGQNNLAAAITMSEILRRVCVVKYPEAVALSGQEWIDFLNAKSTRKLDDKTAVLLLDAPFAPESSAIFTMSEMRKLWHFCFEWVGANL